MYSLSYNISLFGKDGEEGEGEGVREEGEKQEGWERGVINGRNPNNNYLGTVQPSH